MVQKAWLVVGAVAWLAACASAVTKQTATVNVNLTKEPIFGVAVVHKYSDVYNNRHEWGIIPAGGRGNDTMRVEYNTGFGTTGRDWWLVTWFDRDFKTVHYTDPTSFRGVIDRLEGVGSDAVVAAAAVAATLPGSVTGAGAVAAAAKAAKAVTEQLFNSESTRGFKQHILRVEDAGRLTTIAIRDKGAVAFFSESGASRTVSSTKPVKGRG